MFTELSAPSPASPGLIPGPKTPPNSLQVEIQPAGRNSAMQNCMFAIHFMMMHVIHSVMLYGLVFYFCL